LDHHAFIIIGAGPAGLAAAYELAKEGRQLLILEKADKVGGISRTEVHKGYRFDIGGHRFLTTHKEVQQLWEEMLGADFRKVPRLSRLFYKNRFFKYPLDFFDTLANLGLWESILIVASYLKAKCRPHPQAATFEQYVSNHFGQRLYRTFFKGYTEKVWGVPCNQIEANMAAQRIAGLSLKAALVNALFGYNRTKTLTSSFHYPILGPGMMWERFQQEVENRHGQIYFNNRVIRINHDNYRLHSLTVQNGHEVSDIAGENFISSMPLTELIARLDPPAPPEVLDAVRHLAFRDFIMVGLIVNQTDLFPDNWIYVHSQDVRVGRIQNFRNWSPFMVPDPRSSSLGMEYFCSQGDDLWGLSDQELIDLARRELIQLGLWDGRGGEGGVVFRQTKAYPVYNLSYKKHLAVIRRYLEPFGNLQVIGRSGTYRYNNMDHSMITGFQAARHLMAQNQRLKK
jgi:protoporphyrinogen oxidase